MKKYENKKYDGSIPVNKITDPELLRMDEEVCSPEFPGGCISFDE